MALSNYLLQTLVCTLIFSTAGFFLHFQRWQLLLIVPFIWVINTLFSLCWLRYFPRGPMEQLWRILTRKTAGSGEG
ncbi:Predicted membrane protein [Tatumella ptyseos]|nr:Predicted membrane protein [Tatumella ptyseos]